MLVNNKVAVIFGAGGSLGGAVAKALAGEGATVYLSGRTAESVQRTADDIGKDIHVAVVDALDRAAVQTYIDSVVSKAGRIDICFNAVGWEDVQNIPLTELDVEDFLRPVERCMRTNFITSTTVARAMKETKGGVILCLTATPGGIGYANVGGFGPACRALEGMVANLASELGPYGIRVVDIRSGGSPDSRPFLEAREADPEGTAVFLKKMEEDTMLKRMPMMQDIAHTAVFLASDRAANITGITVDITGGTTAALNYKVTPITFIKH